MGTNSNIKNYIIMTALSSSVLSFNYEEVNPLIPTTNAEYNFENSDSWKYQSIYNAMSFDKGEEITEKENIILEFSNDLISNSSDIDSEFVDIVNDNFWDLF